jgi:hypothetical protein
MKKLFAIDLIIYITDAKDASNYIWRPFSTKINFRVSLLLLLLLLVSFLADARLCLLLISCWTRFYVWVQHKIRLLESITVLFDGILDFSILVEVFIVNLFSIFLLESTPLLFSWNSLASRKAVALANFFKLSTLLFLQPNILV